MPQTMHILYAGAGDIATRCATLMKGRAARQWALRRSAAESEDTPLQCLQADLTMPRTLERLPKSITHVLYTATPSLRSPEAYAAVYDTGLRNLIAALDLSSLQRFIFVSSTAVYGHCTGLQDESSPTPAPQFNGQALLKAEQFLQSTLGDKAVAIRFSGIYGPERMALIQKLMQDTITVAASPGNWANRIHIDDVTQACAHLLQLSAPEPVYIATDDTPMEIADLYDQLAAHIGAPAPAHNYNAPSSGKRFSNTTLKESGWTLKWPDTLEGYRAIIASRPAAT
ncbi:NAD-dependent epimerase/dehydratase family protein [Paenalcaligenes niemegkensis]|uniref:NAD-dependent epimerase/dehydratase family protein n=1 Tax=Paenalcaligenes niemegkensis TaxID=2895469 RepID=UPI001EE7E7DF|nr:NAD-dependent epimerase/dehydratase family protein [Paenalcaligenes niemegkensis]MCQ9617145.1 NAD-dependent epimerase/dehydratase family protein [Paenalcaligenes niemegkensis]